MKPDLDAALPAPAELGPVHLVAIGGIGMSGIARILLALGVPVSGSDSADSPVLAELRTLGARVHLGHRADQLGQARTVVVSSAVREDNPELVAARRRGLRVLHRSQALASLMTAHRVLAVAGTHGKTTTTSMLVVALARAGLDPSFAVGGELVGYGVNAHLGTGELFVAEADESDGSFLLYRPSVAVVTNVEADHLDHYGTAEAVTEAFGAFAGTLPEGGTLICCQDDPGAAALAARTRRRRPDVQTLSYGTDPSSDVRVTDLRVDGPAATFTLVHQGRTTPVVLSVPGRHNALNAAAAWTAAVAAGLDAAQAAAGVGAFTGTRRRYELRGRAGGVTVVDDYAHHPTEVAAVLATARAQAGGGRVVAVFQPHLYSRTRAFAELFGQALGAADEVLVLDVYAAREDPDPQVDATLVARAVPLPAARVHVQTPGTDGLGDVLGVLAEGDLLLTIGAGDVTRLGPRVLSALEEHPPRQEAVTR